MEEEETGAGGAPIGTMLEQAHDIGAAVAKLDLLGAAHDTTRAMVEDVKGTLSWLGDRINTLETTIANMAEKLAELKPAGAIEAGAEGVESEGGAAIDAIDPQPIAENVGERKQSPLSRLHSIIS